MEAFRCWALCPSWPLRQNKRTIWNQTSRKSESGEESEQTPLALSYLRCFYAIAGFGFRFPFHFVLNWWLARLRLKLNTWMAFFLSLFGKISLMNRRLSLKGNCQKCKLIFVHDAVAPSSGCFLDQFQEFNSRSSESSDRAKLKPENLS